MKKFYLLIATLVLVAGCGVSVRPTFTSDGRQMYSISCDSGLMYNCTTKAGEICKDKGFTVIRHLRYIFSQTLHVVCEKSPEATILKDTK